MGESQFLDLILLAMIAGFLFLRLRSVLGRRTGHEQPPTDGFGEREKDQDANGTDDNVIQMPDPNGKQILSEEAEAKLWEEGSSIGSGLTQIKIADHNFDANTFLQGARMAYEMIVDSFAKGDKDTLRNMLDQDVYEDFARAIDERERLGHVMETTIAAIESSDIVEARLENHMAEVTVKILAETVTAIHDKDGEVVEGGDARARVVTDIWTFSRDTRSGDPNWVLIETRSQN